MRDYASGFSVLLGVATLKHLLLLTSVSAWTGLAGASVAVAALQNSCAAPIKHLREMNPHVMAALGDWKKHHVLSAYLPRQQSACASSYTPQMAGTSSMGMSGVNAHLLLSSSPYKSAIESEVGLENLISHDCHRLHGQVHGRLLSLRHNTHCHWSFMRFQQICSVDIMVIAPNR